MSTMLTVRGLQVEFPGLLRSTPVLRGVDLDIDKGDIMGLVGESGSGKSMTAMACLGMVQAPGIVQGSIELDGREIVNSTTAALSRLRGGDAAMIFQNPSRSMNPFFTIGQQLIEIIRCHRPFDRRKAQAEAMKELKAVQIPDPERVMDKFPHQLSGGQVQRVMIALALACRPKLLIADEPTTALDVTVQAQIMSLLLDKADRMNLTILFITHDLGVVSSLCNRVAVMYEGRIVESGPVEDVIDHPGHPYTAKLIASVPVIGQLS